jgi:glycosyltransferase involved in cell wall biosynthesis
MIEKFDVGVVATHIHPALGFGGVAMSAARLTAAWAEGGRRRIGICSSNASEIGRIQARDVLLGSNVDVRIYNAYWFRRWGFGLGALQSIASLCRHSRSMYIHGIATWPTSIAALICMVARKPFVVAPRGGLMPEHVEYIQSQKPWKWLYYKLLTIPTLRSALSIHCTGDVEAAAVRDFVSPDVSVTIIANGISLGEVAKSTPPPLEEGLHLCYVGRISQEKGINSFIRAWLEVRRPEDRFIVAGGNTGLSHDAYFSDFLSIIESSDGALDFRGYVESNEVAEIVGGSHFLVFPSGLHGSVRDNFGNVVAEALALGRPVMCCSGLVWDDLDASGAGLIFDRNTEAAKAAIQRACGIVQAEWACMSSNARQVAESSLDINVLAERVWQTITGRPASSNGHFRTKVGAG